MTTPARFTADVLRNRHNRAILQRWRALALPDGWLVAGCLFQTVWNLHDGAEPEARINDYDIFYFDASDVSEAAEQHVQQRVNTVLADLGITAEAKNQARVHLWYPEHFGFDYPQLHGSRDGIARFLVPGTCVGMRPRGDGDGDGEGASFEVHAPYGLAMLYEGLLTMNPLTPHRELFEAKVKSYRGRWGWLRVEDGAVDVQDRSRS